MINWTKLTRENNSLITTSQITLHIVCINFQDVFFENNFREFGIANAVCEEIIRLHIFIESRSRVFLKRSSFINEDAAVCFAIILASLV